MVYITVQDTGNCDYSVEERDGEDVPILHISCYTKSGERYFLRVYGDRITPYFGVPYEEFWKIKDSDRIVRYERGPDSPFGEPVMNVFTKLPFDVNNSSKSYQKKHGKPLLHMVSHSYEGDVKYEKRCKIILGIKNGYFMIDEDKIERYGYINADYIKGSDHVKDEDKFDSNVLKIYWDTEWDMSMLKDEFGRVRRFSIKDGDWKISRMITAVFSNVIENTMYAFTWHPSLRREKEFDDVHEAFTMKKVRDRYNLPDSYPVRVHGYTNEKDMIRGCIDYIADTKPDALIGYNSAGGMHGKGNDKHWINGFDMPFLFKRMEYLELPYWRISPIGDVYWRNNFGKYFVVIKMLYQGDLWHSVEYFDVQKNRDMEGRDIKNQKLDTLERAFLGFGKLEYDGYVWDDWKNDPKHERRYCQGDVEGTMNLDIVFGMTDDERNRALFSGSKWDDGRLSSNLHDMINLNMYHGINSLDTKYQVVRDIYGNKVKEQLDEIIDGSVSSKIRYIKWKRMWITTNLGIEDEKVGGYVPVPIKGMNEDVVVIDFNKFYPNSAMVCNAGPETFVNTSELRFYKKEGNVIEGSADGVSVKLSGLGIKIVDKRPYLIREVDDWDLYDPSEELIGWKETEYEWDYLIRTPSAFFLPEPVTKNTQAFEDLIRNRKVLQALSKEIFKKVKNYYDPLYMIQDRKQFSFKGLTNARFGVTGLEIDRLYMLPIFNTCTLVSRILIMECILHLLESGYKIVGGDTDSVFVKLKKEPEFVKSGEKWLLVEGEEIAHALNMHIREYAVREFNISEEASMRFNVEMEDYNDYFYIKEKKRYIKRTILKNGVFLPEPESGENDDRIFFKGFKRVRRETSHFADELQDRLASIIMSGGTMDEAAELCTRIHEEFSNKSILEISKNLALNKPVHKYPKSGEHYKAFTMANDFFNAGFGVGSRAFVARLKYCPPTINGRRVPRNLGDVIAFNGDMIDEILEAGLEFDWDLMEDKAVAGAMDELLPRYNTTYWEILDSASTYDPLEDYV